MHAHMLPFCNDKSKHDIRFSLSKLQMFLSSHSYSGLTVAESLPERSHLTRLVSLTIISPSSLIGHRKIKQLKLSVVE